MEIGHTRYNRPLKRNNRMDSQDKPETYNAHYYATSCGEPYQRNDVWLGVFDFVAGRIHDELGPRSVLDAGCAMGFLVEKLRQRGIEAWGIDISSYAISQVHESVQAYCRQGSILGAFPQEKYDLIVCLEVLEHLSPSEGEQAVANICKHTDDVLFSSTPVDFHEPTHQNVQPVGYWVDLFARHGFVYDIPFDASFVSPWAIRLRRMEMTTEEQLRWYQQQFWTLRQHNIRGRDVALEFKQELSQKELAWRARLEGIEAQLAEKAQEVTALHRELDEIKHSRSWGLVKQLQRLRALLIPPGSRREAALRILFGRDASRRQ